MTVEDKQEKVVEFVKAFAANEEAMQPFKEHRTELRHNYVENGWLTKEDVSAAVKAYRMLKTGEDPDRLKEIFETLRASGAIQ